MDKKPVLKFWGELENTTRAQDVINRFKNRDGYDSERNLQRYAQVYQGCKNGDSLEELTVKTGWSEKIVQNLMNWFDQSMGKSQMTPIIGTAVAGSPSPRFERHQRELRGIADHILSWAIDFSNPEPLSNPSPPITMPYGGQTLTAHYGIEDEPIYQALAEHLAGNELWGHFLRYQEVRMEFWLMELPQGFDGSLEMARSEEAKLVGRKAERVRVWSELQESVLLVTRGFRELLMWPKIPGECRGC